MALKPCRECGAQVSTEADVCPHCGVHSPTVANPLLVPDQNRRKQQNRDVLKRDLTILAIILGFIAVAKFAPIESTKPIPSCSSDWTKCTDNEQLVKNYSRWSNVQSECKTQANKQARYGTPKWPFLSEFATFRTGNAYVATGTAVAIEPDAQFQNGFGAMVHSRVTCTYDLRAQRVISVDISER